MKAKLLKPINNNVEIPANTEVEIVDGCCGCNGYYYTCIIPDGRQININSNLLEIIDYTPYINWEQRKYEITKSIMQGMVANPNLTYSPDPIVNLIKLSISCADAVIAALIAELKKKQNEGK